MPNTKLPLKIVLALTFVIIVVPFFIYWLWQRQPKGLTIKEELLSPTSQNQSATSSAAQSIKVTVDDNKVTQEKKIQLGGQTQPKSLVVIYSDTANSVVKSDEAGSFISTADLENGLNLIGISVLDANFKEVAAKNLTYFQTSTGSSNTIVYAGLVKSIFENTITLTTQSGDMPVKKDGSTKIDIPKLPGVQAQPQDQDIRVGDYMIALGKTVSNNQLEAKNINILRDNKPQNQNHYSVVKIVSSLTRGTFSAQEDGKNNTVKILTDNDTAYFDQEKQADQKAIAKNRSAIIIFHEDEKANDVANLVYLLP